MLALSHWHRQDRQTAVRERVLTTVLRTFQAYPIWTHALLVVNAPMDPGAVPGSLAEQVVRPGRKCSPRWIHNHCHTWEALRALREIAGGGGCDLEQVGACSRPRFGYYLYAESDLEVPWETFDFWRRHVEQVFRRGRLLTPHRKHLSLDGSSWLLTDVVLDHFALQDTIGLWDEGQKDVYVQATHPGSGAWFLNRAQFSRYVQGGAEVGAWSFDALAAWDKRQNPGEVAMNSPTAMVLGNTLKFMSGGKFVARATVTHVNMSILHHFAPSKLTKCLPSADALETLVAACKRAGPASSLCGRF